MSSQAIIPQPLRTFTDPVTGVMIHQLTDGPEPSCNLYFTRPSWLAGGQYLLLIRRSDWRRNYHVVTRSGQWRQITDYRPEIPDPTAIHPHMHRRFLAWELAAGAPQGPVAHPTQPWIAFADRYDINLLDVATGADEIIYTFPASEATPPLTNLGPVGFSADGQDLFFASCRHARPDEPRLDPPEVPWDFSLRDESRIVGKLWRYDFEKRQMAGVLFESNGEQSHPLPCPWDSELLLWVNYLHKRLYLIRRGGTGLRSFLNDTIWQPGHYNWDTANRRLTVLLSDTRANWRTHLASLDIATGELCHYPSATQTGGQYHQNASPDGRWVVLDAPKIPIGGSNGLHLLDLHSGVLHPLCVLNCSWGITGPDGKFVKSEFLHPNPSWSPDGRYVIVRSDFGGGVDAVQVYLVDMATWQPDPARAIG
jgi:hypothetical protein